MIHVVKIENVYKTVSGREAALRRCVLDSQSLIYEFSNRYYSPVPRHNKFYTFPNRIIDTYLFADAMKEFIEYKKLHIVNETPVVRIDDHGFYKVDVIYEIEEPTNGDI